MLTMLLAAALAVSPATTCRGATMTKPTIARVWKGRVVRARADAYERYWLSQLPPLRAKALALDLFREDRATESEFTSVSYWAGEQTLLAANNVKTATEVHHLPRDAEFLIEVPKTVQVLRVLPDSTPRC